MSVGEFCNREVVVVTPDDSIQEAVQLMREYHVGDVVVVKEREGRRYPAGILTDRDILLELVGQEVGLDAVTVGDVMSTDLLTVRETDSIMQAVESMRTRGVRRTPVVSEEGALVGILAVDDLIDLAAEYLSDLVALIRCEQRREEGTR